MYYIKNWVIFSLGTIPGLERQQSWPGLSCCCLCINGAGPNITKKNNLIVEYEN